MSTIARAMPRSRAWRDGVWLGMTMCCGAESNSDAVASISNCCRNGGPGAARIVPPGPL